MFSITKGKKLSEADNYKKDTFLLNRAGRYTALEGLRGIAVLMVFFVHFFAYYNNPEFLSQKHSILKALVKFLNMGHIGVDLFFVLSGFFIAISLAKQKPEYSEFMIKRFYRLLPAHIVILIVLIIKNQVFQPYIILTNVFFINIFLENSRIINIVTWSLGYEVLFYTLYGLWNIKLKRIRFLHSGYAFAAMFALMWSAQWWGQPLVSYVSANTLKVPDMSRFIGFLFGIVLAKLYLSQKLKGRLARLTNICVVPAVISLILLQWHFEWGRAHKDIYFVLVGLAFTIVTASVLLGNKYLNYFFDSKLLRFTGVISYSFYLVHPITIGLALALSKAVAGYESFAVHLISAIVLTYFVSAIMFLLLEKPYFTNKRARQ